MKKNLLKLVFVIPAIAALALMAYTPAEDSFFKGVVMEEMKEEVIVENPEHNFGTIAEDGGKVTAIFIIYNGTKEAINLTEVRASCGCTTPAWTKEPIEPGQKGEITATYNPKGRPGNFNKSITAKTNTGEKLTMRITGTVTASEKK